MQLSCIFGIIMMGMKSEKIILKNYSVISSWHLSRSITIPCSYVFNEYQII